MRSSGCPPISHSKSIWRANSRALRRSVMLAAPRAARAQGSSRGELARKMGHLERCQSSLEALVSALQARAVDGLFESIAGEHAKNHGHAGIHLRELHAARDFRGDVLEVRGFAAQNTADGHYRVVIPRLTHFLRGNGNLKRAGHPYDFHLLRMRPSAFERVERSSKQAFGDEAVEAADDDTEAQPGGAQRLIGWQLLFHFRPCSVKSPFSLSLLILPSASYFPLNCAGRFSRNARVPSRISSVAQHRPNSVASRNNPSSCGISVPCSTASMANLTASGALAMIFLASASAAGISSAGSTTRFTRPMRSASAAEIISPVRISSCAAPLPHSRARRCEPP